MDSASDRYAAISAQFYGNRLLFGDAEDARTVAIEIAARNEVELFKRTRDGDLTRLRRPLRLFALVSSPDLLQGLRAPCQLIDLAGDFRFRYLIEFASTDALDAARRHLRNVTGI